MNIVKICANPVVDYAAEELKKYLRMMMPDGGDVAISYDPMAQDGFRLGLMENFGLDTSEALDLKLDDILHIDTDVSGGIIAGRMAILAEGDAMKRDDILYVQKLPLFDKNGEPIEE